MTKRLLVINGHPDPRPTRYCAALCDGYEHGAKAKGWETQRLEVGALGLASISRNTLEGEVQRALAEMRRADRMIVVFPLWLNEAPPMLQTLFERFSYGMDGMGRCAERLVVTMELPALLYKSAQRDKPAPAPRLLPAIAANDVTMIGSVTAISDAQRRDWIDRMQGYGALAA